MTYPTELDDAIEVAAWRLAIDMDTGYTEGRERELAAEVRDAIPDGERGEALRWLIGTTVSGITVGAVSMLDETDEGTYAVSDEITGRLFETVAAQGRAEGTLLHLIAHEISEREHIARVLGHPAS